jgi:hypothetical protein
MKGREYMKAILLILLALASKLFAAPYLTCDINPLNTDNSLNVVSYVITGLGANPITVQATTDANGGQYLHYDLATLPNGQYSVTAAALNYLGLSSPQTAPLTFTKGAPATPLNLRLSPT